jgi:hypothetical protein
MVWDSYNILGSTWKKKDFSVRWPTEGLLLAAESWGARIGKKWIDDGKAAFPK